MLELAVEQQLVGEQLRGHRLRRVGVGPVGDREEQADRARNIIVELVRTERELAQGAGTAGCEVEFIGDDARAPDDRRKQRAELWPVPFALAHLDQGAADESGAVEFERMAETIARDDHVEVTVE